MFIDEISTVNAKNLDEVPVGKVGDTELQGDDDDKADMHTQWERLELDVRSSEGGSKKNYTGKACHPDGQSSTVTSHGQNDCRLADETEHHLHGAGFLGWALTVYKVQRMTLDQAYIQLDSTFFASRQAYVALSRVRELSSLHLLAYDRIAVHIHAYFKAMIAFSLDVKSRRVASRREGLGHCTLS